MKILLLTGAPGVGKTTVLRKVAGGVPGWKVAGFYTEEMRSADDERCGFRLMCFDGRIGVMARVDFPGPHRIGKYGVDMEVIDALAPAALSLDQAADIYLVDEVGKMECLSERFIAAMASLLESGKPVVATVALHGEGFIDKVKHRPDVQIWQVTRANRDALPADILAWLTKSRESPAPPETKLPEKPEE